MGNGQYRGTVPGRDSPWQGQSPPQAPTLQPIGLADCYQKVRAAAASPCSLTVSCYTLGTKIQECAMPQLIVQEEQIKNLIKEAILELVREQREVLYDMLAEVIEDLALAQAIQEGESTETASQAEVLKILEGTV